MLDYETLRLIWWLLLGVLLIGFAVMDGFDLGTAILLPWVGRTDTERRIAINEFYTGYRASKRTSPVVRSINSPERP